MLSAVFASLVLSTVPFSPADAPPHQPPSPLIDFRHLDATLTIEPEKGTVVGELTHTFRSVGQPRSRVTLHLSPAMTLTRVTDGAGKEIKPIRRGDVVVLPLAQAAPTDADSTLKIQWRGAPTGGMHFVTSEMAPARAEVWTQGETMFARGWIPVWDYPNERFTSAMAIRVKKPWVARSIGKLVQVTEDGVYRTYHWAMEQDHVAYLLSLNIGKFLIIEDKADGAGPGGASVPLQYVIYPEQKKHLRLGRTADILRRMGQLTGVPYPYARYEQVIGSHFASGGMENITKTTIRADLVSYDDSVAAMYSVDGLVAHEVAHMWFGDMVTCRDWAHIWLNEGFATYFTLLYFEVADGSERFIESLDGTGNAYFGETAKYKRPMVTYEFERPGAMFDSHTYAKGAWFLHMLRRKVGDTMFFAGVTAYLKRFHHGVAETSDFRRVMEDTSGINLRQFFQQWAHGPGHVEATVTITDKPAAQQLSIAVKQSAGAMAFPLAVRVAWADETTTDLTLDVSQKAQTFELVRKGEIRRVELDPELAVLRQLTIEAPTTWLVDQATHGSTSQARVDALRTLAAQVPSPTVTTALEQVMADAAAYRTVRTAAAAGLATFAGHDAVLEPMKTRLCDALAGALKDDKEPRVRRAAALGLHACPAHGKVLLTAMEEDASLHVRGAAGGSLAQHEDPPKKPLTKALASTTWNGLLAKGVASGLAKNGSAWALDALLSATKPGKVGPRDRAGVVAALAKFGEGKDPAALARVRTRMIELAQRDKEPFVVVTAVATLAKVGHPSDRPVMDAAAERIPGKWTHKKLDRWRRMLAAPKKTKKP